MRNPIITLFAGLAGGICGSAVIFFLFLKMPVSDSIVSAHVIELKDQGGRVRARLSAESGSAPGSESKIVVSTEDGKARLIFSSTSTGDSRLLFQNRDTSAEISGSGLRLFDSKQTELASLSVYDLAALGMKRTDGADITPAAALSLSSPVDSADGRQSKNRIELSVDENGQPFMTLKDNKDRVRLNLGSVTLGNSDNQQEISRDAGSVVIFGTDEKIVWAVPEN